MSRPRCSGVGPGKPVGGALRRGLAAALGVAAVLAVAAAPGETDDPDALRARGLKAEFRRQVAEAKRAAYGALATQADEASKALAALPAPKVGVSGKVWADLTRVLSDDLDDEKKDPSVRRTKGAKQVAALTEEQLKGAEEGWQRMAGVLGRADAEAEKAEPKGRSRKDGDDGDTGDAPADGPAAAAPAPWFDEADARLLRYAALAVAVGLALLAVDLRVANRRWWRSRGGRASFAALACLGLAAAASGCKDPLDNLPTVDPDNKEAIAPTTTVDPEQDRRVQILKAWADDAESRAAKAEGQAKKASEDARAKLKEAAQLRLQGSLPKADSGAPLDFPDRDGLPTPSGSAGEVLDRLVKAEVGPQEKLIEAAGNVAAVEAVTADADRAIKDFQTRPERAEARNGQQARAWWAVGKRLGFVLAATGAAWVPLIWVRRGRRRRLHDASGQCPRCLNRGSLSLINRGDVDFKGRPINRTYCSTCHYEYQAGFSRYERITFPTVGVTMSGKTRWLLTLYHMINGNQAPPGATFRTLPLAANTQLDEQVQTTLIQGVPAPATQVGIWDPLVFYHRDRDKVTRPSEVVLNVFDYSGEMMINPMYRDILRRALDCNGCLLFLDPINTDHTAQNREILRFLDELAEFRSISPGRKIDIPVAVCIPKIDRLVEPGRLVNAQQWLKELHDSAVDPISLRTIRWRSEHFAYVADQIFSAGNLKKTFHDRLGGRVMFFPLSPVGIDAGILSMGGQVSQNQPNVRPFGVLEPVYWLMHMNGYNVLG